MHFFLLTEADGARVFAAALMFHEKINSAGMVSIYQDDENDTSRFYCPKVLCITSHWPFYNCLGSFLWAVFEAGTANAPIPAAIERLVTNLIFETPLPPRGRTRVLLNVWNKQIVFQRPCPNELPLFNLDPSLIFHYLSLDNILVLFACVVTEKRVLFVSEKVNRLTEVIETIAYLMFPFYWRQIYIPVLPKRLIDFVCAPMPFLAGVHKSYIPDEQLLTGVVLVDIDSNTIVADQDTDPIRPLPEKSGPRLQRALKKLTGLESNVVCPPSTKIDLNDLSQAFLKFFTSIMKNYKDFMEPPSEFVIDKFNKQKFLDSHSEKCEFLVQFLTTQTFQCFVDDRYEASPNNLEILLFDEAIERENGKGAAFLTDTSNIHKEDFVVPTAVADSSLCPFRYAQFPSSFDPKLCLPIRPAVPLFDSSKESEMQKIGLGAMSMKFFTDKNLYSRHFHSLRIRSTKQDLAFREIVQFLRVHQNYLDTGTKMLSKICQTVLEKEQVETGTTVDIAWDGILRHIEERTKGDSMLRPLLRENVCVPMYVRANEVEHELRVLFEEARKLDRDASKGKSEVDRSKTRYFTARQRLKHMKADLKSIESYASLAEINKKIAAESELHDTFFQKIQSETSFRGIVSVYDKRMPRIIEEVRRLNGERISNFKISLEAYLQGYQRWLSHYSESIAILEGAVKQLDVEKDLKSFKEGKLEFLELQKEQEAEENIPRSRSHSHSHHSSVSPPETRSSIVGLEDNYLATNSPVSSESERSDARLTLSALPRTTSRYSLDMWGLLGFQMAHAQSLKNKTTVKSTFQNLDEYMVVLEWHCKSIQKILKVLPVFSGLYGTQDKLWSSFLSSLRSLESNMKHNIDSIRILGVPLKVLKGVIKHLNILSIQKKDKLAQDVAEASEVVQRARDKRDRVLKEFQTLQKDEDEVINSPQKSGERIERARGEFRQSENDFIVAKRYLMATQETHDISLGNILDVFQEKESQKRVELQAVSRKHRPF
jgi:hypothetical protein